MVPALDLIEISEARKSQAREVVCSPRPSDYFHRPFSESDSTSEAGSLPSVDNPYEEGDPIESPCKDRSSKARLLLSPRPSGDVNRGKPKVFVVIRSASAGRVAMSRRDRNKRDRIRSRSVGPLARGGTANAALLKEGIDKSSLARIAGLKDSSSVAAAGDGHILHGGEIQDIDMTEESIKISSKRRTVSKFASRVMRRWGGGKKSKR